MRPPKLAILRQHIGQSGNVREQVAHRNLGAFSALKLRDVVGNQVVERHQPAVHQDHQCAARHRLRDRRQQEDRVRLHRGGLRIMAQLPEAAGEHDPIPSGHDDRCGRDGTCIKLLRQDQRGRLELSLRQAHRRRRSFLELREQGNRHDAENRSQDQTERDSTRRGSQHAPTLAHRAPRFSGRSSRAVHESSRPSARP